MGFFSPRWFSSFSVTRVSSAAMKSAAANASAARGVKSPRLPMGVATMYKVPAMAQPPFDGNFGKMRKSYA